MKRFAPLLSAIVLALPVASQAAITFAFDPDGAPGGVAAVNITKIDPSPGSALSIGGDPAGGISQGDVNKLLYQANIGTFLSTAGVQFTSGSGTGAGIYYTIVTGVNEVATNVTATTATFGLASAAVLSSDNYFYIYRNNALANDLAGTGFVSSTLVMSGHVVAISGSSFTVDPNLGTAALDGYSAGNAWDGVQTVQGVGATNMTVAIDSVNAAYFPTLTPATQLYLGLVNSSLITPFDQVDPSLKFTSNGTSLAPDVTANVGAINGFNTHPTGGTYDFIFQADANLSLKVPEPASIALTGLALAAAGLFTRRRQAK